MDDAVSDFDYVTSEMAAEERDWQWHYDQFMDECASDYYEHQSFMQFSPTYKPF